MVFVVLKGAERPPALGPTRLNSQRFAIEHGRIVQTILFTGFRGLFRKLFEILRGGRFRLWKCSQGRSEKNGGPQ